MAVAELSHFAWPYRLGVDVEQDSADEQRASAALVLATERGQRPDDPVFGVTQPVFGSRPLDAERLVAEVAQVDPRLQFVAHRLIDMTHLRDPHTATIRVHFTEAPGA